VELCRSFYATQADLAPGLRAIENQARLAYVSAGSSQTPELVAYQGVHHIPTLGPRQHGKYIRSSQFLIFQRPCEICTRISKTLDGHIWYVTEYRHNPSSLRIMPGGLYEKELLLEGHVESGACTREQDLLGDLFAKHLFRSFKKVGRYWFGPEALHLQQSGVQLCDWSGAPRRRDFPHRG
jgi:hypothetical protein